MKKTKILLGAAMVLLLSCSKKDALLPVSAETPLVGPRMDDNGKSVTRDEGGFVDPYGIPKKDIGIWIDPDGRPVKNAGVIIDPNGKIAVKEEGGWTDPFGKPNQKDIGPIWDPNGKGMGLDPNGRDGGSLLDPWGKPQKRAEQDPNGKPAANISPNSGTSLDPSGKPATGRSSVINPNGSFAYGDLGPYIDPMGKPGH